MTGPASAPDDRPVVVAESTPDAAPPGWWRRNRIALLLLPVLAALAALSASFVMLTLYLPWEYHRAHVSTDGSPVHLQQSYVDGDRVVSVDVTVRIVDVRTAATEGDVTAAPGSRLWVVYFGLQAPADSVLEICQVTLVDAAGRVYGTNGGTTTTGAPTFGVTTCVPEGATGPRIGFPGMPDDSTPRPESWGHQAVIAVPEDVQPVAARIGWHQPDYVELPLRVP